MKRILVACIALIPLAAISAPGDLIQVTPPRPDIELPEKAQADRQKYRKETMKHAREHARAVSLFAETEMKNKGFITMPDEELDTLFYQYLNPGMWRDLDIASTDLVFSLQPLPAFVDESLLGAISFPDNGRSANSLRRVFDSNDFGHIILYERALPREGRLVTNVPNRRIKINGKNASLVRYKNPEGSKAITHIRHVTDEKIFDLMLGDVVFPGEERFLKLKQMANDLY